jgi:hypothetical protein
MPELSEGSLTFSFPETWVVSKYDQWPYYKNQFKDRSQNITPAKSRLKDQDND